MPCPMATPASPSDPERKVARTSRGAFTYTEEGEGPVVVAVHGLPGSARDFRWLGAALPRTVRFVRLEMPGFGGSPLETEPGASLGARGAFVAEAVQALGLEGSVLLGHSMGGGVVMAAAAQAPGRFRALALLSSIGLRPHRMFRRLPRPGFWARAVDAPGLRRPLRAVARQAFLRSGFSARTTGDEAAHTLRCVAGVDFQDQRRHVAALRLPTLLAHADDDAFIEPAVFAELAAALPPGPRLAWPEGGHNVQKSRAVELAEALVALAGAPAPL